MSTHATPALDASVSSIELTKQICDIESVSGNESALADAIEAVVRAQPHLEVLRFGDTVVARTSQNRAQRVLIAGHIDTVPVNENLPTRFESEDGVEYLWGRGTVDMKAGVAVQLKLAVELTNPTFDITWMWYDHEDVAHEHNGLNRLSVAQPERFTGDFAILGEPSNGTIEGGCNGNIRVELRTFGRRAHSARNWLGDNAIEKAAPILTKLANYQAREVEVDGLVYRESLSAVGVSGGIAGNVIPDECMVHVNYRFAPNQSVDEAIAYLRQLFPEAEEFTVVDAANGARPGLDAPLAQSLIAEVGQPAKPKYGWTDVARFAAMGIPAVNFGPGDPGKAHADDERVAVVQITETETALRNWLS